MNTGVGKEIKIKTDREKNHKRLLNTENKLRVAGWEGRWGWFKCVMGIKEGTFRDEHWVPYVRDESLVSTPEAKTTSHVN